MNEDIDLKSQLHKHDVEGTGLGSPHFYLTLDFIFYIYSETASYKNSLQTKNLPRFKFQAIDITISFNHFLFPTLEYGLIFFHYSDGSE